MRTDSAPVERQITDKTEPGNTINNAHAVDCARERLSYAQFMHITCSDDLAKLFPITSEWRLTKETSVDYFHNLYKLHITKCTYRCDFGEREYGTD